MAERRRDGRALLLPRQRALGRVWADLPLWAKGLVVVAVPLAALVAAMGLYGVAERQDRQAQGLVLHAVEVERQVAQVRILGQTGVTVSLLTGLQGGLDRYRAANRDLPAALARLEALVGGNPAQLARLKQIRARISRRVELNQALLASARSSEGWQAHLDLLRRSGRNTDALIQQLDAMQAEQQRLLAARQGHARRTHARTVDAIVLSVLLGVAGGLGAILVFTVGIVRRVRHLEGNAGRLAGGLPLQPAWHGGDALGHLGQALDRASVLLGEREGALREARALLEHVVTWSPMVMARGLLGGTTSPYISPNAERLLGFPPEEITRTPGFWVDQLHPDDRAIFVADLTAAIAAQAPEVERVDRFRHHDGSYRWLYSVTRLTYEDGRLVDTLGYALDVTDRRLATDALRDREATLEAIISASPDVITTLDRDGRIRFLSPAMQRVIGLASADRLGINALTSELLHPDDREPFAEAQRRVLSGEAGEAMLRLRVRHADGHWVFLEAHSRPLEVDGGLLIVSRDVTGQVALEEDLREAKAAAERANQAKSEYLSRMSHELRTPLNAILGFGQLLDLADLPDPQRKGLRQILSAGRHLLTLIDEVLDIAAIEAGRMSLSLEPVPVADVIAETLDLVRPLATHRDIHLHPPATGCDRPVHADRQRLRQILLNLLSNAVKYNHPGGAVHLTCQPTPPGRLRINVTDTGPGIPDDQLDRLFVPFDRLGAEQTSVEGTGLGLAVSKRLAEAMDGTLNVTTTPGHGSTFAVELPLAGQPTGTGTYDAPDAAAARADDRDDHPQQEQTGPPLVVLHIEDNVSSLELVAGVLGRRPGVTLISAMRPQLGLDLAAEHRPDLILLDLHLPDMPGEEVLHRLRADPATAAVPVVILSADVRPAQITRLLERGARTFLTKPFKVTELLTIVDDLAAERSSHRARR